MAEFCSTCPNKGNCVGDIEVVVGDRPNDYIGPVKIRKRGVTIVAVDEDGATSKPIYSGDIKLWMACRDKSEKVEAVYESRIGRCQNVNNDGKCPAFTDDKYVAGMIGQKVMLSSIEESLQPQQDSVTDLAAKEDGS